MGHIANNIVVRKTNELVDRIYVRLFPTSVPDTIESENGALLFHKNGNVSLNYENQQVADNIKKHMEALEKISMEKK
ncbi:hypothetical protein E4T80_11440 [Muribacter muris]|uniref:Uncharacterized protein n=1 Tax=Muribacter muris TaxID=67855 RepID=A0A4Y9JQ83_9PAST|nr:hypothetical protein [Muribacter muris]MBF0786077.1 hypothetical protein [Muribacter muris]MBF0827179.1 hypothetical protein [Muribacter muris]TFV07964.1 hypothetical protein E4T80_11440 [Muribacter muris]